MNKLFLSTDQQQFQRYQNQIITYSEIYIQASKELARLDVKSHKAESLTNGGFLEKFHQYHKAEHAQPEWERLKISYLKYLDLKELNVEKLSALESEHDQITGLKFELYEFNNSFFTYAESQTRNTLYQEAMKLSPEKKVYKVVDLLTFKGNIAKVDIPKKPFEIYALNKLQIDLLQNISDYVDASRKLGLKYSDVLKVVENYVKRKDGRSVGLSFDLTTVEFSFNQILNQRL